MKFVRGTKWFKALCDQRAEKLKVFIYARTSKSVPKTRKDRFRSRLYKSVKHAASEEEAENLFYAEEARILEEHRHYSYKMWMFCSKVVLRASYQINYLQGKGVTVGEFLTLKRQLFKSLCKAGDDADVNRKVNEFFQQVRREYVMK